MFKIRRNLPALLVVGSVLMTSTACTVGAYGSRYGNYGPYGYSQQFQRRAYDHGYRDGRSHGWDDVRHRRDFSYWRIGDYRDADDGYRRGDGDRNAYRDVYRRGFQAGYTEAFNQGGFDARARRR
jgi:hypothetical protein